jgi:hypothetical protein
MHPGDAGEILALPRQSQGCTLTLLRGRHLLNPPLSRADANWPDETQAW